MNKVYSDNTQLQYAYYDLPFVCPPTGIRHPGSALTSGQSISLNLGEVLRGDRIMTSDIELAMGQDQECGFLCTRKVSRKDLKNARDLVKQGYVTEWIVDNLPGATSFVTVDKTRKYYAAGFKMGYKDYSNTGKPRYYLNNHLTIVLRYRKHGDRGEKVIVGFEVYTKSIGTKDRLDSGCPADVHNVQEGLELYLAPNTTAIKEKYPNSSYQPPTDEFDIDDGATLKIPYSYSVYFREDEKIEWAHRWDMYFVNQEEGSRIHWLAIVNSLIIAGLLSAIVAMILARTIRTDIKGYRDSSTEEGKSRLKRRSRPGSGARTPKNMEKTPAGLLDRVGDNENDADISSDDESLEDITGWKLLHGDVFRAPSHVNILAPILGSGIQLLFMTVGLLSLSCIGILNPSFRGGFISVGVGLFIFAGAFSGYFSGRIYHTLGGSQAQQRKNTLLTATLFPGLLFAFIFFLNFFVWAQASSTALPFSTLVAIVTLWLCIQLPLVYIGSYYGYSRSKPWSFPTKTIAIARQIPVQPWSTKPIPSVLLAGLIPFAVIFIELLFVFQSLWQDKSGYYYVFGFLFLITMLLLLTVAEVTIVSIYMQLCAENHEWWWRSFFVGGGASIWVFVYCCWYFIFKLKISGFISGLLFFAYSLLGCVVFGLLMGTVGVLTGLIFVRRIYGYVSSFPDMDQSSGSGFC